MIKKNPIILCTLLLSLLILILSAFAGEARQQVIQSSVVAAITNVTVIPMDGERMLGDHTVVVEDGLITVVGPTDAVTVPEGAQVIDGEGKYLVSVETMILRNEGDRATWYARPEYATLPPWMVEAWVAKDRVDRMEAAELDEYLRYVRETVQPWEWALTMRLGRLKPTIGPTSCCSRPTRWRTSPIPGALKA